jgi:fimbrial chaperone protein
MLFSVFVPSARVAGMLLLIFGSLPIFVTSAAAGQFGINPIRMFMAPRDRAIAVTVSNEGDKDIVLQADLYTWKQDAKGLDVLVLTDEVLLSPPIVKLAPKSKKVLRLAVLRPRPAGEQLTYRMIMREVIEAVPPSDKAEVQISVAYSLPIFVTPLGVKRDVSCVIERVAADTVRAVCENTGNAYGHVSNFVLASATGEKQAELKQGGYILQGVKRSFDIKRLDAAIPAGKAKLTMSQDDGTVKTFEVTVAE